MSFNVDYFINEIKKYISNKNTLQKSDLTDSYKSKNTGFQSPIKSTFYNSGGFDATGKGSVGKVHPAVDMRAPGGTAIFPIAEGIVTAVRTDPKGGNTVNIKHDNGYTSYYAHLGTIKIHQNDKVSNDTLIGTVGESGNAKNTVPHLHLQVWSNGSLIDPGTLFNIPKYTNVSNKEVKWLPNAKERSEAWSIVEHNSRKKDKKIAALLHAANTFERIVNSNFMTSEL